MITKKMPIQKCIKYILKIVKKANYGNKKIISEILVFFLVFFKWKYHIIKYFTTKYITR